MLIYVDFLVFCLPVLPGIALHTHKRKNCQFKNILSGPTLGRPLSPSEWRRLVPDQLSSEGDLGVEGGRSSEHVPAGDARDETLNVRRFRAARVVA